MSRSSATRARSSIAAAAAARPPRVRRAPRGAPSIVAAGEGRVEAEPRRSRATCSIQQDGVSQLLDARQSELPVRLRVQHAALRLARRGGAARRRAGADAAGGARPDAAIDNGAARSSNPRGRRSTPSDEVVTTQQKALELARESVSIAQVSYENGVITSAELNDAQVRLLQTEWLLMQAKYARITAAARAKVAAGVS